MKFNAKELTVIDGATLCRRISDLVGGGSKFPNLGSSTRMIRLYVILLLNIAIDWNENKIYHSFAHQKFIYIAEC